MANYGAEIVFCKPTLEAREEGIEKVVDQTSATFIHPYNDHRVISGQGTAALELCEEILDLDVIMTPVGGGGEQAGSVVVEGRGRTTTLTTMVRGG